MELATEEEKEAMEETEQRNRNFFAAMEANILRNLQQGLLPSAVPNAQQYDKPSDNDEETQRNHGISVDLDSSDDEAESEMKQPIVSKQGKALERPDLVRTISSMDEHLLRDLVMRVPSHRNLMQTGKSQTNSLDHGISGSFRSSGRLASRGNTQAMDQSDPNRDRGSSNPNALRESFKQVSLGTMLATLPEEENSMNAFELSFGDESHMDIGLSHEESEALIKLSELTNEMANVGEGSESELLGTDYQSNLDDLTGGGDEQETGGGDEQEMSENIRSTTQVEGGGKTKIQAEDPFSKMDNAPRMSREAASLRLISTSVQHRPKPSRRNTCGTLYVGSTMAAPDVDATIKCVCGVVRAHILQSDMGTEVNDDYAVFNDQVSLQRRGSYRRGLLRSERPSLDTITEFYRDVFKRAQMESDCIIMSLIYIERLIKCTSGALRPCSSNWRSILFSCMVLASKVWDDLSMWNADFSQTCPAGVTFTLQRINELELAVLDALEYIVKVPASEYAKYYFLLRSMLIKSGLGSDDVGEINPLDVENARRLQAVSGKYQRSASLRQVGNRSGARSKSLGLNMGDARQVGLEQILDM